jgi:hypothetical protein
MAAITGKPYEEFEKAAKEKNA